MATSCRATRCARGSRSITRKLWNQAARLTAISNAINRKVRQKRPPNASVRRRRSIRMGPSYLRSKTATILHRTGVSAGARTLDDAVPGTRVNAEASTLVDAVHGTRVTAKASTLVDIKDESKLRP